MLHTLGVQAARRQDRSESEKDLRRPLQVGLDGRLFGVGPGRLGDNPDLRSGLGAQAEAGIFSPHRGWGAGVRGG